MSRREHERGGKAGLPTLSFSAVEAQDEGDRLVELHGGTVRVESRGRG